jgi:hypothetical protein
MKALLRSVVLISLTAASGGAVSASTSADVLATLQDEIRRVRAAGPEQEIRIQNVPNVQLLTGHTLSEVRAVLGEPDALEPQVVYVFFHLPSNARGGGPELVLTASTEGTVAAAAWRFSR